MAIGSSSLTGARPTQPCSLPAQPILPLLGSAPVLSSHQSTSPPNTAHHHPLLHIKSLPAQTVSSPSTSTASTSTPICTTNTWTSMTTHTATTVQAQVDRLRHELQRYKVDDQVPEVGEQIYIGEYLVQRLVQLGVTVSAFASLVVLLALTTSPGRKCLVCPEISTWVCTSGPSYYPALTFIPLSRLPCMVYLVHDRSDPNLTHVSGFRRRQPKHRLGWKLVRSVHCSLHILLT